MPDGGFDADALVIDRDTDRVPIADRAELVALAATETASIYRGIDTRIQHSGNGYRVQVPAMGTGFGAGDGPALMMALVLMPLWVAYIIRYFGIMTFFAPIGPLSLITDDVPRVLYSSTGVVIGLANVFIPFAVLPIYNSMNAIDTEYIDASRMLGAGYFRTIANVVIPLSLPGVVAAGLIVFILSAGSYLAPSLLGGPQQTMIANQIAIAQLEAGNSQLAAALSTIYTVLLILGLLLFNTVLDLQEVFAKI